MFLKRIELENVGPIERCILNFPFDENGNPKPSVIVGENGSGKSIVISHIVNALFSARQELFDNTEVEKSYLYKVISPSYIKTGEGYYFVKVLFEGDLQSIEWSLNHKRKDFEESRGYCPFNPDWGNIPEHESTRFWENFSQHRTALTDFIKKSCLLYFPANRYEDPAWLNEKNLNAKAEFTDLQRYRRHSNRSFIQYSPMKANQNWLFGVLYDSRVFEAKIEENVEVGAGTTHRIVYDGNATRVSKEVSKLLKAIFQIEGEYSIHIGGRNSRTVGIVRDNLFLSIIRDYDLTDAVLNSLDDIKGTVLVDEIDLHLHSNFQYYVLPQLMRLFPKIQFIVTSHSPLFLLGLNRELGNDGFRIFEMPQGDTISVERFNEFGNAYSAFKETKRFVTDLQLAVAESQLPIVFVEGDYDVMYLQKAAELLGKGNLLSQLRLKDANGYGGLDKIFKHFDSRLSGITPQKIILLYDCDIQKRDRNEGNIIRKTIELCSNTPIRKGIENLFPFETIEKAASHKRAFIDFTPEIKKIERGEEKVIAATKEINMDEKRNLCRWLCENGNKDDFVNFEWIFKYLSDTLKLNPL
jgi:hypothetical protein